ncbi:tetratricopeptide repeat protein [Cohnella sp. GCM10027633]|uniref:tetratricopeptide repeat protein n=1 Tax=unclassified Cohnella TaxID=2636738 RepID=UPI0036439A31
MKRLLLFMNVTFLILCVACTNSDPFEESMKLGKEALKSGNFEEAIKQFDIALIDEPSNKDAIALFERANKSKMENDKKLENAKAESENIKKMKPYRESRLKLVDSIKLLAKNVELDSIFTVKDKILIQDDLSGLRDQLKVLQDFDRETSDSGLLRNIDQIKLDDKLEQSISRIESSFKRKINFPDSKYNNDGIESAKVLLSEWISEVDKYK